MKKILFILGFALMLSSLNAQNSIPNDNYNPLVQEKQSFYKHEIGISCGLFAAPLLIPLPYLPSLIPNLNVDYYYNFNAKHSIGVSYSIATDFPFALSKWIDKSYIDEHPEINKDLLPYAIFHSIQIGYRINFLKAGKFTFYSSFFAGVNFTNYIKNKNTVLINDFIFILPALQVTPLGFTYGKQNRLNFEVGIGARGFINIGYRYHFNK